MNPRIIVFVVRGNDLGPILNNCSARRQSAPLGLVTAVNRRYPIVFIDLFICFAARGQRGVTTLNNWLQRERLSRASPGHPPRSHRTALSALRGCAPIAASLRSAAATGSAAAFV
ncbi:hypothetical protein C4K22_2757 [Pseudomonas chlororaphis subsp. aurantiaca]|nr:hypothetical protein C4K22_2757 [Pseudomonas chlororaphis subsp. aurantiaca]AZD41834.1 hypothetical protein C4K21_2760 [Pseudomonas chlororaphis subsp. aurantiaca]